MKGLDLQTSRSSENIWRKRERESPLCMVPGNGKVQSRRNTSSLRNTWNGGKSTKNKRAASLANITTEEGIMLRMCRTIQVEGAFGLMKHDFGFRRFFSTGKRNIRTELFFLAMGFNLKKRWMKQSRKREKTHLSTIKTSVNIEKCRISRFRPHQNGGACVSMPEM